MVLMVCLSMSDELSDIFYLRFSLINDVIFKEEALLDPLRRKSHEVYVGQ